MRRKRRVREEGERRRLGGCRRIIYCLGGEVGGARYKSPVPYCPGPVVTGSAVVPGGSGEKRGRGGERAWGNLSLVKKVLIHSIYVLPE